MAVAADAVVPTIESVMTLFGAAWFLPDIVIRILIKVTKTPWLHAL